MFLFWLKCKYFPSLPMVPLFFDHQPYLSNQIGTARANQFLMFCPPSRTFLPAERPHSLLRSRLSVGTTYFAKQTHPAHAAALVLARLSAVRCDLPVDLALHLRQSLVHVQQVGHLMVRGIVQCHQLLVKCFVANVELLELVRLVQNLGR